MDRIYHTKEVDSFPHMKYIVGQIMIQRRAMLYHSRFDIKRARQNIPKNELEDHFE